MELFRDSRHIIYPISGNKWPTKWCGARDEFLSFKPNEHSLAHHKTWRVYGVACGIFVSQPKKINQMIRNGNLLSFFSFFRLDSVWWFLLCRGRKEFKTGDNQTWLIQLPGIQAHRQHLNERTTPKFCFNEYALRLMSNQQHWIRNKWCINYKRQKKNEPSKELVLLK